MSQKVLKNTVLEEIAMLADDSRAQQIANLIVLYRSCVKSRHPHSREMARRYEQELRQLGADPGSENGSRSLALSGSV
jgi:hypothetical protein